MSDTVRWTFVAIQGVLLVIQVLFLVAAILAGRRDEHDASFTYSIIAAVLGPCGLVFGIPVMTS